MRKWMISMVVMVTALLSTGCGQGPTGIPEINGIRGPLINMVDGKILLTMKLLNLNAAPGFQVPIPETRNSTVEFAPNVEDGGMMLVLHMDIEDLRDINIGLGDGNYLPDGRPLPGIPGGRLENSLRIDTQWRGLSFFYHKTLFGVWIPFGFETAGISGYWNMNFAGRNIGMLGLVGNDNQNRKAGGIIFLRLNNLNNPQLKRLIKLSKRNPHIVY